MLSWKLKLEPEFMGTLFSFQFGVEYGGVPPEIVEAMKPIAHAAGVPAKAMNEFANKYMEFAKAHEAKVTETISGFAKASEAALRKEFGADFEPNLKVANKLAAELGPDFKALLNETMIPGVGMLGDHPVIVRALAVLGRGREEGGLMVGGGSPEEKSSAQAELDALNKSVPVGTPAYASKEHQAKLEALYAKIHGKGSIVGGSQRVA